MSPRHLKMSTNVQSGLKPFKSHDEHLSIDEIDRKILKFLMWDARLSYREIARQTKLSTTTVIERLKKLKTSNVIKGYSVNLDPKKLGYELSAIIEIVAPKLSLLHTMEEITEIPNVYAVYHTTGNIDAIIIAKFRGIDDLQKFLGDLYNKLDIQRSETRIVLNTVKEDFRVIL